MEVNIHDYSPPPGWIIVFALVSFTQLEKIASKTTSSVTIQCKMVDFFYFCRSMLGGEYNTALANQSELFTCVGYTTNSFFTQRCQKKNKKPTSQDGKVIWEFLKLANNAGTIYSKVLRWCVILPILLCALGLWDIFVVVVVVVLQRFFEIADLYVQFTYSLQTRHRARFTY